MFTLAIVCLAAACLSGSVDAAIPSNAYSTSYYQSNGVIDELDFVPLHKQINSFGVSQVKPITKYGPRSIPIDPLVPNANPLFAPASLQRMANKFGLISVRPLLTTPSLVTTVAPSNLMGIENRLRSSPFVQNNEATMITVNNRRLPLRTLALALQQSNLLANQTPKQSGNQQLDIEMIANINNGAAGDQAHHSVRSPNALASSWYADTLAHISHGYSNLGPLQTAASSSQAVGALAPNLGRLPLKNRRFRATTLGALGYGSVMANSFPANVPLSTLNYV